MLELTSAKKIVLTTEKDYMRLLKYIGMLSYLEIETMFLGDAEVFKNEIKSYCNTGL